MIVLYGIILGGVALLMILHLLLERLLCSSGDAVRRKFLLEMSTAGAMALGWITMLVLTLLFPTWRGEWLGMMMLSTPFILGGILFFSYLSYIVYHQDTERSEYDEDMLGSDSVN